MLAANNQPPPPSHPASHHARRIASPFPGAPRTRLDNMSDAGASAVSATDKGGPEAADGMGEDHPRLAESKARFMQTSQRIEDLFRGIKRPFFDEPANAADGTPADGHAHTAGPPAKKQARQIDEDDYGDDDDEDDDEMADADAASPLQSKSHVLSAIPPNLKVSPLPPHLTPDRKATPSSSDAGKTSDDVRKKLEEDKKAIEDAAKRSFHTMFYTLEYDRDAMLEQQKLDELDRQIEADISGQSGNKENTNEGPVQQGTLSSANLGASSLTLKHLIARIDSKRGMVQASDAQLRNLISEVRKNRSKWASEERVGQEELYEAAEKVLIELKAMTEYSTPFLQRVNKREAPDYHKIIEHPMDIGTMLKRLKSLHYVSKKQFVDDLNLIWSNCLKYNNDPNHPLRKKALYMRKETEKLVPLIPDIVIKNRSDMDDEGNGANENDGAEDSDDEPIMASRGRKAPKKGGSTARTAPSGAEPGTPGAESKPQATPQPPAVTNARTDLLRADSDMAGDGSRLSTPPGNLTPLGPNGVHAAAANGSQADASEMDASGSAADGALGSSGDDPNLEDNEFKTWKQVTKKDRAMLAAERHRLFRGEKLNVDEPAPLRSKAGMRRWLRQHKRALNEDPSTIDTSTEGGRNTQATGATLAEGIEEEDDQTLPDYYDSVNAIPDIIPKMQWVEDADGNPVFNAEEFLRTVPAGHFTSPESVLTKKMEANIRQMQNTRKICSKIGVVKQMQLQQQMYQNQFQRYDPQPFVEQDVETHVTSTNGPVMAADTCRAALQRSVAKIFYHAGFEEYQPSAVETVTDIAGAFFQNLVKSLQMYRHLPKTTARRGAANQYKPIYTAEETILHSLSENGLDMESIEGHVKDDVDRLGSKLGIMHDRMRSHLAELMRPALNQDAGPDGAGAFNDNSEQFVGGDFAEDIDEDYLGLKELGLAQEFGLNSLSVPLHLLQNRVHNAYQAQNATTTSTTGDIVDQPPAFEPVTIENIRNQIGLVQDFFRNRLHENNDDPLLEDEDLPAKQRYPKPRLPPTGKITSPRKRPLREQQQLARKKRRIEEGKEDQAASGSGANTNAVANGSAKGIPKPVGKLKLDPASKNDASGDPEKEEGSAVNMISPESMEAT